MDDSSKEGLDLYRRLRFQEQYTWYRDRSDEYETAQRQARLLTALLLLVSATAAAMAAADIGGHHRVWAITVAAAAAGSAAVTSYAGHSKPDPGRVPTGNIWRDRGVLRRPGRGCL